MHAAFNRQTFPRLYLELRRPILRYVLRSVRDGDVAEELTQEVFLKAFRARERFESHRSLTAWLWTIARNTVCDWHRKRAPGQRVPTGEPEDEPVCETLPCPQPDAEALLSQRSERQALQRLLDSLTELQREVLLLRVIHELPYREIARRLGLSVSAAKCLFYRARLSLSQAPAFA